MPKSYGFTLIELLIIIVIIGILSTIGVANYSTFSATQSLNDSVNQIVSILRTAQANATSSVLCSGETPNNSMKYWGANINQSTIRLVCIKAGDSTFPFNDTNITVKSVDLPNITNTITGTSSGCAPWGSNANLGVDYSRLSGNVTFDSGNYCSSDISFTVEVKYTKGRTPLSKKIVISQGGVIDVK